MTDLPEWRIVVAPRAERDLRNLSPANRRRIAEAIERLRDDPFRANIRKLKGQQSLESLWRLRVGDWRVRLDLDPENRVIYIHRVLHRREAYRTG